MDIQTAAQRVFKELRDDEGYRIAWRPMPDPAKIREPGPQEQVEVS